MPNWCSNSLVLRSRNRAVLEKYSQAFRDTDLLKTMRPQPTYDGYIENGDWYDWRVNNWGTKWEIYPEHGNVSAISQCAPGDDGGPMWEVTFFFESAWAPPIEAVIFAQSVDGFDFRLCYFEPGADYIGQCVNGEDETYSFSERKFPEEIALAIGLVMEEWEEC